MNTGRPRSLSWIAILLLVIAIVSAVSPFLNQVRVGAPGNLPIGGNFQPGQMPQGDGNFQPLQGDGTFQPGANNGRVFQGQRGGFGLIGNLGLDFQIINYISIGLTVLGVLLTLLAAFGAWKQKRWGLNLALIMALIFVLAALPTLFMGGRALAAINVTSVARMVLNYVRLLAALPVLVLSSLPSTRDFTS
jgi:hypothetical protein